MSIGPRTPLPARHLAVREEIMNGNGINYIYPLGRDYGIKYPGNFDAYDGSAYSVFGYIIHMSSSWEVGITGKRGGTVLMKTGKDSKITIVAKPDNSDSYVYKAAGQNYYDGQPFMLRYRAEINGSKEAIVAYENGVDQYKQEMAVTNIAVSEYFRFLGTHVLLTVHYGDFPPTKFPLDKGLDLIIPALIVMDIGAYAVYEGIYSGSDPINIIATGAVRDLGKPSTSGVNVRIGIRKNLTMYVFVADYGSAPVAAPFAELVKGGHAYIPRFTANFNIRRIQIESYF